MQSEAASSGNASSSSSAASQAAEPEPLRSGIATMEPNEGRPYTKEAQDFQQVAGPVFLPSAPSAVSTSLGLKAHNIALMLVAETF